MIAANGDRGYLPFREVGEEPENEPLIIRVRRAGMKHIAGDKDTIDALSSSDIYDFAENGLVFGRPGDNQSAADVPIGGVKKSHLS